MVECLFGCGQRRMEGRGNLGVRFVCGICGDDHHHFVVRIEEQDWVVLFLGSWLLSGVVLSVAFGGTKS